MQLLPDRVRGLLVSDVSPPGRPRDMVPAASGSRLIAVVMVEAFALVALDAPQ